MPDLADELQRVADEAARDARPLPVAEVMALGDRRRRCRRSLNVLAAALAAGSVVAITALTSSGAPGKPDGPRPAGMPGGCSEQVTLAAPDGRISGCVSYRYGPGGLQVRSVTPGLGITQDGHIAGAGTRQHVAGAVRPMPPRSSWLRRT